MQGFALITEEPEAAVNSYGNDLPCYKFVMLPGDRGASL